ncbi:MAG: isoprenyl transferase [Alphaproteobacteria bacterium]|jgi:undecaprenyl diphosphate synthase|nr:isoprenyl transferase [Alphaproteobacteria bacterium]MDP6515703.1 isoprenyl transferase [Alphaproteobacteria bacterium]|tara:strand:+ start:321 stop:1052 length:732 start_codon:yes stop_codon:yes gene_type:complete
METAPSQQDTPPPAHIAIIMDGNGRWATSRGLPRIAGHQRGADAVRNTVRACADLGVRYLTLYAFSSENWKRPLDEVQDLMGLLRVYLRRELERLAENGVRMRVIGERAMLDADIQDLITMAEARTRHNDRLNLTVALNYGARNEIMSAVRAIARGAAAGTIDPEQVTEADFETRLETVSIPDPDLLIRTSGERRLSNFLLWQCAYTELIFVQTLWPDFGKDDLEAAIEEFHQRERRYGGTGG